MQRAESPDIGCLTRACAGDQEAQSIVIRWVYPVVARTVRANLPRRLPAEDVEQDVLIKVLTSLSDYRGDGPLEHWAARLAIFTCIDVLRKERRRKEVRLGDLSVTEMLAVAALAQESARIDQAMAADLVDRLLDTLSAEDQLIVRLIDLQGHSIRETAELTGRSVVATKVRAFRARRQLRSALRRWGVEQ